MTTVYRISMVEHKHIDIEAKSQEEAEVRASESDAWTLSKVDYNVFVLSSNEPHTIINEFEKDYEQ